jgi:hypothetical protein
VNKFKNYTEEEARQHVDLVRGVIDVCRRQRGGRPPYKAAVLWHLRNNTATLPLAHLYRLAERAGSRSKNGDKKSALAAEIVLTEALSRLPYRQGFDGNGDEVIRAETVFFWQCDTLYPEEEDGETHATPMLDAITGKLYVVENPKRACWEVLEVVHDNDPLLVGCSTWECVECEPPRDPLVPFATQEEKGGSQ